MSATTSAAGAMFRHPAGVSGLGALALGDARRARAHHRLGAGPARRGPVPRQSDAQLLAVIRADLAPSPFHGATARSTPGFGRSESPARGFAHGLLSPHRVAGRREAHDGRAPRRPT